MAQKYVASFPPDFDLGANYIVQVTAVDPTSGADVTSVKVSNVAIMAAAVVPEAAQDEPPDFAPLFIPIAPEPPALEPAAGEAP